MTTPIADFVSQYASSDVTRLHMPGHKGKPLLGCEGFDITEIKGADVLGSADGIIAESESNATALFGTLHSFYSTEGSSLAIKAMLSLVKKSAPFGARVRILAARNAHKAFIYACSLLDIDVEWLYSDERSNLCSCTISPDTLEKAISECDSLPSAVYITSPDYLGSISDIKGLSAVCHKHGIPLLVDNAHGAYLAFLEPSQHPISLGADMCCDSAHKTLPVLTGGAYLHISSRFDRVSIEQIRGAISLFASTSPSYLVLSSLDLCNEYLSKGYREDLSSFVAKLKNLKNKLSALGFPCETDESLKLVFSKGSCGYSGLELASVLSEFKIEPELADSDNLVLMLTPQNTEDDLERILSAFSSIPRKSTEGYTQVLPSVRPTKKLSIREAMLSQSEIIPTREANGRICAAPTVSCPPAIPIVVSGELVDDIAIELLLYYGIEKIEVVK